MTAGTILHGMKLPLTRWFRAVELFASPQGISTRALARALDIPVKTAFTVLGRIRRAVEAEGAPLEGAVGTWRGWLECPRQPSARPRVPAVCAADASKRIVVVIDAAAPEEPQQEGLLKAAIAGAAFVLARLRYTHRQVSERYLERYVRSIVHMWHLREDPGAVDAVVRRCLGSPHATVPP